MPGNIDVWQIFIGCFMPGFIAIKVYGLYRAIDARDFSKKWYDAVGYGVVFFTLYQVCGKILVDFFMRCLTYDVVALVVQFIFFVLLPMLSAYIMAHQWYRFREEKGDMLMPQETPWDYIFSKGECFFVKIYLKNGNVICGKYAGKSFTSAYPQAAQIFIEQQYLLEKDEKEEKISLIDNSAGIWISENEISWIDFRVCDS